MRGRGVVVVETRVGGIGEVYADLRGVSVCIGRERKGEGEGDFGILEE